MVEQIFSTIGDAIVGLGGALGEGITEVAKLFWTPGTGNDAGSFTFLGILLLVATGAGLVYFVIRLIMSLVRQAA